MATFELQKYIQSTFNILIIHLYQGARSDAHGPNLGHQMFTATNAENLLLGKYALCRMPNYEYFHIILTLQAEWDFVQEKTIK